MKAPRQNGLPPGWANARVDEVGVVQLGRQRAPEHHSGPNMRPYLRVANVFEARIDTSDVMKMNFTPAEFERYRLEQGDILLNEGQSLELVGRPAMYRGEVPGACFQNTLVRFRARGAVLPEYALAVFRGYLHSQRFQRIAKWTTNIAHLGAARFASLDFPVPPLQEQRRIVEALDLQLSRIDAAVAALQRAQADLKRYRASVLKAACEGRLVPTEAELARAEKRYYEPASALLNRILVERRRMWETAILEREKTRGGVPKSEAWRERYPAPTAPNTADLPDLPEGWCWATWSQVGFSQNGRSFPSADYSDEGIRLLRPGNLHVTGEVVWTTENTRCMPISYAHVNPDLIVADHELVMNLTAQSLKDEFLGRICMTREGRCLLNQRLARLTPVLAHRNYLLWMFKSPLFRRFVDSLNKGTLIQHMFTSQLAEFVLPLPPLREQERISAEVERHLSLIAAMEQTAQRTLLRADRLRQSLLQRAFEGKLVPQDPSDEPASVLLARIRAQREAAESKTPARQRLAHRPAVRRRPEK